MGTPKMDANRLDLLNDEFKAFKQSNLFQDLECRNIMMSRRNFERTISATTNLQNFKKYIKYEKTLLRDVSVRRSRLKDAQKTGSLEYKIMTRIKNLYKMASQKFNDFEFCMTFIKFLNEANYTQTISSTISTMLKKHAEFPEAWVIAARYAISQNDMVKGIHVICTGLELHKNSKMLYTEVINLELQHAVGKNSFASGPTTKKRTACAKKLKTYLKDVINNISDCPYFLQTLSSLENYCFTVGAQNLIIRHLLDEFSHDVNVWHTLARREFKGFSYRGGQDLSVTSPTSTLMLCCEKYTEGLKVIPVSSRGELLTFFSDFLVEQCRSNFEVNKSVKMNVLFSAYEQGREDGYLLEKHYISWAECAGDDQVSQVLEKSLMAYPNSAELWQLLLEAEILRKDIVAIQNTFERGIRQLGEKSSPLWLSYIQFHLLYCNDDDTQAIYMEAIKQPQEISNKVKPRFLEWLEMAKGIEAARAYYNSIATETPYCKNLHLTMARFESFAIKSNSAACEKILRTACEQFGTQDADVWIHYLHFYCYSKADVTREMTLQLFNEAKKNLSELQFSIFANVYGHVRFYPFTQKNI